MKMDNETFEEIMSSLNGYLWPTTIKYTHELLTGDFDVLKDYVEDDFDLTNFHFTSDQLEAIKELHDDNVEGWTEEASALDYDGNFDETVDGKTVHVDAKIDNLGLYAKLTDDDKWTKVDELHVEDDGIFVTDSGQWYASRPQDPDADDGFDWEEMLEEAVEDFAYSLIRK